MTLFLTCTALHFIGHSGSFRAASSVSFFDVTQNAFVLPAPPLPMIHGVQGVAPSRFKAVGIAGMSASLFLLYILKP